MSDDAFDAAAEARKLMRGVTVAALGTIAGDGSPFVTLATMAADVDGSPLCLLSDLAAHAANLARDGRASLLLAAPAAPGRDPLVAARLTVTGVFHRLGRDDPARAPALARFLAVHAGAAGYAAFADFHLWRMEVAAGHLVAGFGRIAAVAGALLVDRPS